MVDGRWSMVLLAAIVLLFVTGCRTVREGPVLPADSGVTPLIHGSEPMPAPIQQREVPEGQSPLRKTGPDQPR